MSCDSHREILSAMLDGEADPSEVEACLRHLESCPACARYRDELEASRTLLREWPQETLGPASRRWLPVHLRLAAAAAIFLALGLGFLAGRSTAPSADLRAVAPPSGAAFRETQRTVYPELNEVHSYVSLQTGSSRIEGNGGLQ